MFNGGGWGNKNRVGFGIDNRLLGFGESQEFDVIGGSTQPDCAEHHGQVGCYLATG